jgi:hypothetical protein
MTAAPDGKRSGAVTGGHIAPTSAGQTVHVRAREEIAMSRALTRSVVGLALAAWLPSAALAADTCNGFVNIDYIGAPPVTNIGDTVRMKLSFGTGTIQGGTKLTIQSFQLNLDCNANFPLIPPCVDEGAIVQFEDNVTTTCPVAVSTGHVVSPNPNEVIFSFAGSGLDIPANVPTLPGLCAVEFDVRVLAPSIDGSGKIEQLAGYDVAACDNGVLVSGGFQTSAIETPPPLHFDCYEIRGGGLPQPKPVVTLHDVFGTYAATLREADRLCAPTNKNGEDPTAPMRPEHLTGYEFVNVAPNLPEPSGVQVATQFGNYTVDVRNPFKLLVPTAKSLVAPPPPAQIPSSLRHYLCHDVEGVQGPKPTGITVQSQFAANVVALADLNRATLCAPVDKNGEDPGAPMDPTFLMCFRTNEQNNFGTLTVFLTNQFGPSNTQFTGQPFITQYDELCVPATLP